MLPVVRRRLAGTRQEAQGLEQKLSIAQSLNYDLRQDLRTANRESLDLRGMVLAEVAATKKYKSRATRRGWVVGGLVALLSGLTYVSVAP